MVKHFAAFQVNVTLNYLASLETTYWLKPREKFNPVPVRN